jgi:hypothetical protein
MTCLSGLGFALSLAAYSAGFGSSLSASAACGIHAAHACACADATFPLPYDPACDTSNQARPLHAHTLASLLA